MARELLVRLIGDDASLRRSFTRSSHAARDFDKNLSKSARGALAATVSFRGLGRAVAFGSNAFLGGAGVAFAAKQIITETSRVQEEIEKTGVVFGANARQVQDWSKTLAESFGVSEGAALSATGTFGNMLRPLGFGTRAAADMSERLVELAADMASFNNVKPDVVLAALSSGLAGQVRPLRQYGVFLSQTRIQQEAVADGISKTGKNLTQAQKVQASYNIILKDTRNAQGDVARNTGSLSVAMSKLTAGIEDLEAGLGTALLPTLTAYVNQAAKWLNNTENQQRVQRDFAEAVSSIKSAFVGLKALVHGVDEVTGSFKNTMELLIGLKVVSVLHGWTKALLGFEIAAGVAGGGGAAKSASTLGAELAKISRIGILSVGLRFPGLGEGLSKIPLLRGQLTKLALLRGIVVPITIAVTAEEIGKAVHVNTDFSPGKLGKDFKDLFHGHVAKGPLLNFVLGNGWQSDLERAADNTSSEFKSDPAIQNVGLKTFKNLRKALADSIAAASIGDAGGGGGASSLTADQRNTFFDNAISRILLRGGLGDINQQIAALQKADTLISARLKVTKDVTRRLNLEDQLLQNQAQISDLRAQAASDALQNQQDALQKRKDAFSKFISVLQLDVTKAQTTSSFADDLATLNSLQAGIKAEIQAFGKTSDLAGQLFDVQQQIKQTQQRKVSAEEFFTLGLGPTGDARVPLKAALKKRLGTLSEAVKGTFLDTPKTRSEFANISKVLSRAIVPSDVRSKVKEMFDQIREELDKGGRNLTKFKHTNANALLAGLGLDSDTTRILRQRLAQVGAGGTVPGSRSSAFSIQQPQTINLVVDGKKMTSVVTSHQRRSTQRRTDSRRGPYAGRH